MSSAARILLVAPEAAGAWTDELDGEAHRCREPYDALLEMGRRRWPTVVLAGGEPELPSFCRAARRLQAEAKIFAVCPPPTEPELRALESGILDDYFIRPPTGEDLRRIRRSAAGLDEGREHLPLPTDRLAELLDSTYSRAALETCLAGIVSDLLGVEVAWADAGAGEASGEPLLLLAGDTPRVLTGPANWQEPSAGDRQVLRCLRRIAPALAAAARRTEALHQLAITDHLTGAFNRRYFYYRTDQILTDENPDRLRATLLLYDIDDFRRYNTRYGHAGGDEVLREMARLMRRITRRHDIVARIGGDEFAVLFWDTDPPRAPGSRPPEHAWDLADRLRQAVRGMEFPSLGPEARGVLSISGGLASFPKDGRDVRELLRAADVALRQAKRMGKNAIYLVGEKDRE